MGRSATEIMVSFNPGFTSSVRATLSNVTLMGETTVVISPTAPTAPFEGQLWSDTTANALKIRVGTGWVSVSNNRLLDLTDTPNSYTGQAGKILKVNQAATGMEFADDDVNDKGTSYPGSVVTIRPAATVDVPHGVSTRSSGVALMTYTTPADATYTITSQVRFFNVGLMRTDNTLVRVQVEFQLQRVRNSVTTNIRSRYNIQLLWGFTSGVGQFTNTVEAEANDVYNIIVTFTPIPANTSSFSAGVLRFRMNDNTMYIARHFAIDSGDLDFPDTRGDLRDVDIRFFSSEAAGGSSRIPITFTRSGNTYTYNGDDLLPAISQINFTTNAGDGQYRYTVHVPISYLNSIQGRTPEILRLYGVEGGGGVNWSAPLTYFATRQTPVPHGIYRTEPASVDDRLTPTTLSNRANMGLSDATFAVRANARRVTRYFTPGDIGDLVGLLHPSITLYPHAGRTAGNQFYLIQNITVPGFDHIVIGRNTTSPNNWIGYDATHGTIDDPDSPIESLIYYNVDPPGRQNLAGRTLISLKSTVSKVLQTVVIGDTTYNTTIASASRRLYWLRTIETPPRTPARYADLIFGEGDDISVELVYTDGTAGKAARTLNRGVIVYNGYAWVPEAQGVQTWAREGDDGKIPDGKQNTVTWARESNTDDIPIGKLPIVRLTQAAYDALAVKDPNTLYIIIG